MAKLKIWFDQMFLLVKDEVNPVVLFPTGAHQNMLHRLYILGVEEDTAIQVLGADLSIWQKPSKGDRTLFSKSKTKLNWPDEDWLLDFNTLAPAPKSLIRKEVYSKKAASFPTELYARLHLPNGHFDAHQNSKKYGGARWLVGPKAEKRVQQLTDLMSFECELDDEMTYELGVEVDRKFTYTALQTRKGQDIQIVFFNMDVVSSDDYKNTDDPPGDQTDFRVIYDLAKDGGGFDVPAYHSGGPQARSPHRPQHDPPKTRCVGANCKDMRDFKILGGSDPAFPICGGGTGKPDP